MKDDDQPSLDRFSLDGYTPEEVDPLLMGPDPEEEQRRKTFKTAREHLKNFSYCLERQYQALLFDNLKFILR